VAPGDWVSLKRLIDIPAECSTQNSVSRTNKTRCKTFNAGPENAVHFARLTDH